MLLLGGFTVPFADLPFEWPRKRPPPVDVTEY